MEYKVFLCPCKDGNVCNLVVHHHFSLLRECYGNRGYYMTARGYEFLSSSDEMSS